MYLLVSGISFHGKKDIDLFNQFKFHVVKIALLGNILGIVLDGRSET